MQWVPYALQGTTWAAEESAYVDRLLAICDRFAPGTSDLVADAFVLTPPKIEEYFGITRGHIHHIDNGFGFADRFPYRWVGEAWWRGSFLSLRRPPSSTSRRALQRRPHLPSPLLRPPLPDETRTPVAGLYSASAGTHPAGSVIGCAGHNCAAAVVRDLGLTPHWPTA